MRNLNSNNEMKDIQKKALITGVTGQDGSFLAELLLNKGYKVYGLIRRSSASNTSRIDHIMNNSALNDNNFQLLNGDLTDSLNIFKIIEQTKPDEIYNLGAQSHVAISFETPEYTANCDALGTLRILESVRSLGLINKTKIYQASTSELFGEVKEIPQNENTPFHPRSPYGVAKLYSYWIVINYRESYGMFACNGILFNHESSRRGENFVTRKITRGLSRINFGLDKCLYLGNLDSKRDWGHAKDYVEMQWKMMQLNKPDDFVIATGRQETIRKFAEITAEKLGWKKDYSKPAIIWKGKGLEEVGIRSDTNEIVIKVDPKYFRPAEVDNLIGNPKKASEVLNWTPSISLEEMIDEMVKEDKIIAQKQKLIKDKFEM
tara:strand:- start:753 stop:1880 length:1128 start_codon:yes stop_codon:yes gene_type:complete